LGKQRLGLHFWAIFSQTHLVTLEPANAGAKLKRDKSLEGIEIKAKHSSKEKAGNFSARQNNLRFQKNLAKFFFL
jgi:hypothetical protein